MNLKFLKSYKLFKNEKLQKLDLLENQGFCNINYKLSSTKKSYLIRVFKSNNSVNISRDFEYKTQKKAYKLKIAPKPLLLDLENSLMITSFEKGVHKKSLNKKELINLVRTIKKVHKIKVSSKVYDLKKDLENYTLSLKDKESRLLIRDSLKELKKLKKYKKNLSLTHHDLNPKNLLFHKNKIKILDWEYAGTNDSFFDLATICCEFKLSKKQERILLKTYFKTINKKTFKKLNSYKIIYSSLCLLWFKTLE